jgi:acetyl-CoA C-acetyltransferase
MSATPHLLAGSRDGFRMGDAKLVDSMIVDGLWDVYNNYHMGTTAENIARQYGIMRREQDEFAAASQQKAEAAQQAGRFKAEIVPVEIVSKKGTARFEADEYIRAGTTAEALGELSPRSARTAPCPRAMPQASMTARQPSPTSASGARAGPRPLARVKAYSSAGGSEDHGHGARTRQ